VSAYLTYRALLLPAGTGPPAPKGAAGHQVDVHVTDLVIRVWDRDQLLKTVARASTGEVRKKRASRARTRRRLAPNLAP